jgi:hypothetical protein
MTTLELFSEPFARTGNMAAEGFKRLLGRPALGLLQTLVREGIQNVLDAAHGKASPEILIRLRTLTSAQKRTLAQRVFTDLPRTDATRADIEAALIKKNLRVLELCDFGTVGLSGPTSADAPHDGEEPLNFVNFLRNVGARRDTHHGGGTYGYGKSSLYAMSSCSTIVVDSQTECGGRPERRLMGCHLGAAFDAKSGRSKKRFTGRHWWGVLDGSDSIDPLRGRSATSLSAALGMPEREVGDTGTSILIIDPLLGTDDLRSAVDDIIVSVLWNFWPRLTATTPRKRKIKVHVELEGQRIPVPKPEDFPPLDLYAEAMAAHRRGDEGLIPIHAKQRKLDLGMLYIQKGLRADRRAPADREGTLIPSNVSHIALMRPVELVVKYLEGVPFPDKRFEWAGVFICAEDDEVEDAFAAAEPPAHDDWIPDNLPKGRAKTIVNVALRDLHAHAANYVAPAITVSGSQERGPSLAETAQRLGAFLDRVSSTGPGRPPRKPGAKPSQRKTLSISAARFAGLELAPDGRPLARFRAELHNDASNSKLRVIAEPRLVLEGGFTNTEDLPSNLKLEVADMQLEQIRMSPYGPWIDAGYTGGAVEILVSTVPGMAVGVALRLADGGEE